MNYSSLNELAIANVRALLGARRESIEVLSTATSIPLSTIKRRLCGKSPFTLEEIEQIAKQCRRKQTAVPNLHVGVS